MTGCFLLGSESRPVAQWGCLLAVIVVAVAAATRFSVLEELAIISAVAVVVLLSFRTPMFALGVYVMSIPWEGATSFAGPIGTISKGAGIVFLLAYLGHHRGRIRFDVMPVWGWGLMGWVLVSLLWADDGSLSTAFTLVQLFAITLLIADMLSDDRSVVNQLLWMFSASAAVVAAIAVVEFAGGQGGNTARTSAFADYSVAHFAAVLVVPLVFLVSQAVPALGPFATDPQIRHRARIGALLLGSVVLAALMLTGTRSAWMGAAAGLATLTLLSPGMRVRSRVRMIAVVTIAIGLATSVWFAVLPELEDLVYDRAATAVESGGAGRTAIWKVGAVIIEDHPIVGVGIGGFETAFDADAIRRAAVQGFYLVPIPGRAPHNIYLSVVAELGLVGAILGGGFLWWLLFGSRWKVTPPVVYASLVSLLVTAMFLDTMNRKYFWFVIAVVLATRAREQRGLVRSSDRVRTIEVG